MSDLQISDREVKIFNRAQDWLRTAFETMFVNQALFKKIRANLKKQPITKMKKKRTKAAGPQNANHAQ